MLFQSAAIEALAGLHLVRSVLIGLRRKGLLSDEEIEELLSAAAGPLKAKTMARAQDAADLIDEMRNEVLTG